MKLAPESLGDVSAAQGDAPAGASVAGGEAAPASSTESVAPVILLSHAVRAAAPRPITLDTPARPDGSPGGGATRRLPPAPDGEVCIVPEGTVYSGEVLRRAREARGLTVEQICERTRITRQHVENLEADRYECLPAPVYLRGILMALAKQLRLDGQKVAGSYMDASAAARAKPR